MKKSLIATMGLALLVAGPVSPALSYQSATAELKAKSANGISYISGGFGFDERQALRSMSTGDNLQLSFALQNKDYLGGAKVVIKDNHGKTLLDTISDGPLFFAKVPQGEYTVEATAHGKTLKQVAHVPIQGRTQLYFAWKTSVTNT
jgi:hypothetical protein